MSYYSTDYAVVGKAVRGGVCRRCGRAVAAVDAILLHDGKRRLEGYDRHARGYVVMHQACVDGRRTVNVPVCPLSTKKEVIPDDRQADVLAACSYSVL